MIRWIELGPSLDPSWGGTLCTCAARLVSSLTLLKGNRIRTGEARRKHPGCVRTRAPITFVMTGTRQRKFSAPTSANGHERVYRGTQDKCINVAASAVVPPMQKRLRQSLPAMDRDSTQVVKGGRWTLVPGAGAGPLSRPTKSRLLRWAEITAREQACHHS